MDLAAFDVLIRSHQAELYRYARYLGAEAQTAEDLVQDTFLVAMDGVMPAETAQPRVAAAWLRGVLRNLFLQDCRRRRTSPVRVDTETVSRAEEVWKAEFLRRDDGFEYAEALQKCLGDLPDRSRAAVRLHYAERRSREEMGRTLGHSEDGVKSMMRRIRAALADCVRRRLAAEGA
jgi:RNA polymerase sigma-70 factor (ECF subfamily)